MQQNSRPTEAGADIERRADLMMASMSVRSEQENLRWHERWIGAAPSAQEAVRRWRMLIAIELSLLFKHVSRDAPTPANKISLETFEELDRELQACTIGNPEVNVDQRANQYYFSVSVKKGRGDDGAADEGVAVSDIVNEGIPQASPGLEPLVNQTRENVANAMECRFVTLHQKLRRYLFMVGELSNEFGHEDAGKRGARKTARDASGE